MIFNISYVLEEDLNYFLLNISFTQRNCIVDMQIANKRDRCNPTTLITVRKITDILLAQQQALSVEQI